MLPKVAHIDHYVRSRTWVSPTFAREHVDKHGKGLDNCESVESCLQTSAYTPGIVQFTPEELETFRKDHQAYQKFRKGTSDFALHCTAPHR